MKIIDTALLRAFRQATNCEYCRLPTPFGCDPAHVFARGMGGGGRLDIRINLVSLGGAGCCSCHGESHAGHEPTRIDLLAIVAKREGVLQAMIEWEIRWFLRQPKARGISWAIAESEARLEYQRALLRKVHR